LKGANTVSVGMVCYVVIYTMSCSARIGGLVAIFRLGQSAGRELFEQILDAVLRAPISWIQRVQAGPVINRLTDDMWKIDKSLPNQISAFLDNLIRLLVILANKYVTARDVRDTEVFN